MLLWFILFFFSTPGAVIPSHPFISLALSSLVSSESLHLTLSLTFPFLRLFLSLRCLKARLFPPSLWFSTSVLCVISSLSADLRNALFCFSIVAESGRAANLLFVHPILRVVFAHLSLSSLLLTVLYGGWHTHNIFELHYHSLSPPFPRHSLPLTHTLTHTQMEGLCGIALAELLCVNGLYIVPQRINVAALTL